MRGVVSAISPDGTYGQIAADDGNRYSYWMSEVRNGPVRVGVAVNFQMAEGQPVDIFVLPPPGPDLSPRRLDEPAQTGEPTDARGFVAAALAGFAAAAPGHVDDETRFPPVNYWLALFASPSGRVSRRQFWLHGVLPIGVVGLLLGWIPVVGYLVSIGLLWAGISIAFKRFHDVGYPGWYSLVYFVPLIGAGAALAVAFFAPQYQSKASLTAEILLGLAVVVALAQMIFVYVRAGEEGPNRFGPDPQRGY